MVEHVFIGYRSLVIVGPFLAAICDLPGLLIVVTGDGSTRPNVSISRNFSAVIEVIEHTELPGQLVFIGSDLFAIDGQRGIAVADAQITEDLIVSAILFKHIDYVLDWLASSMKLELAGIGVN